MVLLGDKPNMPNRFVQLCHAFCIENLFYTWKARNVVVSKVNFDKSISIYVKAQICSNVMLQCQVQLEKVTRYGPVDTNALTAKAFPSVAPRA